MAAVLMLEPDVLVWPARLAGEAAGLLDAGAPGAPRASYISPGRRADFVTAG
jgi:hypothetical protein